mgnify:CR=1 FL=1
MKKLLFVIALLVCAPVVIAAITDNTMLYCDFRAGGSTCNDESGNGRTMTADAGWQVVPGVVSDNAMYNVTENFIKINSTSGFSLNTSTGNWTVAFVFNINSTLTAWANIFGKERAAGAQADFVFRRAASGDTWQLIVDTPTGGQQAVTGGTGASSSALSTTMFVASYDGVNIRFWQNATLVGSAVLSGQAFTLPTGMLVNPRIFSSADLKGTVHQMVVWNRNLSQSEVTTMYNAGAFKQLFLTPTVTLINYTSDGGSTCAYPTACQGQTFDLTPSFTIGAIEVENSAWGCRASLTDQNFSLMTINMTNTTEQNFSVSWPDTLGAGEKTFYFACNGSGGPNNAPLAAANKANLTFAKTFVGAVVNGSNTTVVNAQVVVIRQSTNVVVGNVTSNSTGRFSLSVNATGNYSLLAYNGTNSTVRPDVKSYVEIT